MIETGKTAQREVDEIALTRYACYLIAQNGDPRKTEIAFAQSYFAVQTRKMELVEKRLDEIERLEARKKLSESEKQLSGIIFERLRDDKSFGRIRSKGDTALFGGLSTQEMKKRLGTPDKRHPLFGQRPRLLRPGNFFTDCFRHFPCSDSTGIIAVSLHIVCHVLPLQNDRRHCSLQSVCRIELLQMPKH